MNRMWNTALAMLTGCAVASAAAAQQDSPAPAVSIELNAAKSNEGGCTLSFLIVNGHAHPIEKAVYETVLFDSAGQVERLTLFDFGTLPSDRPRVRQFTVPGVACDGLSRVLINGAHTCDAPELSDAACEAGLTLNTRTKIEVIG